VIRCEYSGEASADCDLKKPTENDEAPLN